MEIFIEFLLFVLKAFTIAILIFVPIFLISLSRKTKEESLGELKIKNLSNQYKSMANSLKVLNLNKDCLLYTSPSPRDDISSRMPSSA